MPRTCLAAVVFEPLRAASGIFEDQGAAIAEGDFFGLPGGAYSFATSFAEAMAVKKAMAHKLVERIGLRLGWVPRLVEPSEIRVVIGNAPAAFRRRMMKTRSGGGSCRRHGQSGASAIHSLTACHGGSMGSMV